MDSPREAGLQEGRSSCSSPSFQLIQYQGFWYRPILVDKIKAAQESYMARQGDIILCSYPKTGTTWLKALTFAITTRNEYKADNQQLNPLLNNYPHHCIPYIEHTFDNYTFKECHEGQRRLLATHMPYTSLPSDVLDMLNTDTCKMVYICREPKDTLVSTWHFMNLPFSFDEMFEMFCQGRQIYDPYWEHLLGYWGACKKHPETALFLRYEDLKRNTKDNVKKLADFLGFSFSREEEEAGEVERIIELCSFENLKSLKVNQTGTHVGFRPGQIMSNNKQFRKGEIGDWKNMLTPEMKNKLDLIFDEKLNGHGISWA